MRILLVDDEEELVSSLAERLQLRGIDAAWAVSAESAMEKVAAGCPDLAVLDMKMPGIGGVELKQRLMAVCPKMKYLFLTGYGSEAEYDAVQQDLGADHYLVKPTAIEELIKTMTRILGGDL